MCLVLIFSIVCLTGAAAPETGTEASLPLADLPPALTAAAATQDKNIIWYVEMDGQDADQRTISFTASYNAAFLRVCKGLCCSDELAYNGTISTSVSMNTSNTVLNDIEYTYTGRVYGGSSTVSGVTLSPAYYQPRLNDVLLECRFLSYWDLNEDHFTVSANNGNKLTKQWIIIGDVNRDQEINSTDAQLALQYSVNSEVLGAAIMEQKIAADVNEDGIINADDALLINQYSVELIDSFWKDYSAPSTLPTSETDGIVDGATYSFQNAYNANGLAYSSSPSSGSAISQTRYSATSNLQQYVIVYKGSGEYELQCKNNSTLVWAKNTGNELILQTRTTTASSTQRWYIIRNSDGTYQLINKSNTARCLTVEGTSNSNTSAPDIVSMATSGTGNRWRLYRDVGRISYDYYDASFALRYETTPTYVYNQELDISELVDVVYNSHPVRLIGDARAAAAQVFGTLLGVSIKYYGVSAYESLADACRVSKGLSVTSSSRCASSSTGHTHGTEDGVVLHCTDHWAQYYKFQSDRSLSGIDNRINTLWSGAYLYKEGTSTQNNRSYTEGCRDEEQNLTGSAYTHMIDFFGNGAHASSSKEIYIHEMSHKWGAKDHYHEENEDGYCDAGARGVCSDRECKTFDNYEYPASNHRSSKCMMNLYSWWNTAVSVRELYCSECLAEMKAYVSTYYK